MLAAIHPITRGQPVAVDFRNQILERIARLGISKYKLSELVGGDPGRNTLYTYLRGESDMGSDKVAKVLDALDAEEKKRAKR
jgi:hypothetical protein